MESEGIMFRFTTGTRDFFLLSQAYRWLWGPPNHYCKLVGSHYSEICEASNACFRKVSHIITRLLNFWTWLAKPYHSAQTAQATAKSPYLSSQSRLGHLVWFTIDNKYTPSKHLKLGTSIGILPPIDIHIFNVTFCLWYSLIWPVVILYHLLVTVNN